jgi:hypothetical protein
MFLLENRTILMFLLQTRMLKMTEVGSSRPQTKMPMYLLEIRTLGMLILFLQT